MVYKYVHVGEFVNACLFVTLVTLFLTLPTVLAALLSSCCFGWI